MDNFEPILDSLDKTEKQYVLVFQDDKKGLVLSWKLNYENTMGALAVLTDTILNTWIPKGGYKVRQDIYAVVNRTVNKNNAKPDDKTERTMENLMNILKEKFS